MAQLRDTDLVVYEDNDTYVEFTLEHLELDCTTPPYSLVDVADHGAMEYLQCGVLTHNLARTLSDLGGLVILNAMQGVFGVQLDGATDTFVPGTYPYRVDIVLDNKRLTVVQGYLEVVSKLAPVRCP